MNETVRRIFYRVCRFGGAGAGIPAVNVYHHGSGVHIVCRRGEGENERSVGTFLDRADTLALVRSLIEAGFAPILQDVPEADRQPSTEALLNAFEAGILHARKCG